GPDVLGCAVLPKGDELHLRRDLTPPGVVELGDDLPRPGPQDGGSTVVTLAVAVALVVGRSVGCPAGGGPAVVPGGGGPSVVLLDVAPPDDPVPAEGWQPVRRLRSRPGRVVQADGRAVGEVDLGERHPGPVRALDVDLAPARHRALPSPA